MSVVLVSSRLAPFISLSTEVKVPKSSGTSVFKGVSDDFLYSVKNDKFHFKPQQTQSESL